jgi:hypothetical protein
MRPRASLERKQPTPIDAVICSGASQSFKIKRTLDISQVEVVEDTFQRMQIRGTCIGELHNEIRMGCGNSQFRTK